ncbi:MAG: hypothetical protein IKR34_02110 [Candidatus Gastranaerophilales bacterium]|nr:hypothetical protein [Elusimicrobiota bacterium]MBR6298017.1 hypothetical protein [Candidatus Gastranaerophilales bacterium]
MGCYIDPKNETKEEFLKREGEEVESDYITQNFRFIKKQDKLPVILVDNGPFTAAGVAYIESEFERFTRYDNRPKRFYLVPIEKLKTVSPIEDYLKEKEEEWRTRYGDA